MTQLSNDRCKCGYSVTAHGVTVKHLCCVGLAAVFVLAGATKLGVQSRLIVSAQTQTQTVTSKIGQYDHCFHI